MEARRGERTRVEPRSAPPVPATDGGAFACAREVAGPEVPSMLEELPREDRLYRMRHSAAHIMAEAVLEMFPEAKFAIGPPIDNGFYYDFELPRALTPEDLPEIERRMRFRIKSDITFEHSEMSKEEALKHFAGQPFKIELIEGIGDATVSLYKQGSFLDLCEGPHVDHTA